MPEQLPASYFIEGIERGDRVALGRAITLVESDLARDRHVARELLAGIRPPQNTFRIAVTGVPGAGKSSLIESLGQRFIRDNHRIAVLAVDPSSHLSGGSILGDKTRMPFLSSVDAAFVRPSPTRGRLGGVAESTAEAIRLCEAAGFDIVFVETVGVGQAEIDAVDVADLVLLVLIGGAGDELQGMKRGILEIADIVAINKADGPNSESAELARSTLQSIIKLMPETRPNWNRRILKCSTVTTDGIDDLFDCIATFRERVLASGHLPDNRSKQRLRRFHQSLIASFQNEILGKPAVKALVERLAIQIQDGSVEPQDAAQEVLTRLFAPESKNTDV